MKVYHLVWVQYVPKMPNEYFGLHLVAEEVSTPHGLSNLLSFFLHPQYSPNSACPVSPACALASFSPFNPTPHFKHFKSNVAVFVNFFFALSCPANLLAASSALSVIGNKVVWNSGGAEGEGERDTAS